MGYPSNVRASGIRVWLRSLRRADFRPNWHVDRRADGAEVELGLVRITHQVRNVDDRWDVLGNRRRRVDDDQVYAASSAERVRDTSDIYHVSARRECLRAPALARRAHARPLDGRAAQRISAQKAFAVSVVPAGEGRLSAADRCSRSHPTRSWRVNCRAAPLPLVIHASRSSVPSARTAGHPQVIGKQSEK